MSDEEREFLTKERALELLKEKQEVHVFVQSEIGALIGADWTRVQIEKLIQESESIEIGGPGCRQLEHPLVVKRGYFHFLEVPIE